MDLRRWFVYCLLGGVVACLLMAKFLMDKTRQPIKIEHHKKDMEKREFILKFTSSLSLTTLQQSMLTVNMLFLDDTQSSVPKLFTLSDSNTKPSIEPTKYITLSTSTTPIVPSQANKSHNVTSRVLMTRNVTLRDVMTDVITSNPPIIQNVTFGANNVHVNQVITVSNWHGDVMPTQPSPADIVPLKSANYSVCTILMGGLGTKMFQFATTYGLAARKGMSVAIDKTDDLTKIFKFDIDRRENYRNICKTFVGRGEQLNCGYDDKMVTFPPDNNYRVGSYLQSWMYFYNASTSLRKHFVFHDSITETKNKVIDSVLKKYNFTSRSNVTLIGVHIRRGDLVNHTFGYMVASKSYLQKSVNYFQSKELRNVIYIICSNDMKWSKESMPKGVRSEYIEGNSPEVDMAILGSCDHMISTVGTFSWWSAWLTGGEVTFYRWPAKEGSKLRKQFSKDYVDYFYPGWIGFS
ncbi:galactoside 2-alpha-L-fucosyltransferase 2-like [Mizuhopecten yessoensis]|uniref:L-Fucosyltransferase n=1 Tax=Mizuhopecten yessoensis TaxID=6573 RepID=A0A210PUE3_MIZYE|nr:galactoside 2-alpha-L-fucosyltransferase 2-like [Mizuhopecten yessoensis]OWF40075.1 Galactoside 2-alpha-L-fucosyltransferase 2 [Mizuhopecten yessoensis]